MPYKLFLGIVAAIIGLVSYIPYFWGIYRGQIKPHGFTWFVWGVLTGIGFVAQLLSGGGAGSFLMLIYSLLCFSVAIIAFKQGHVKYVLFDWISLSGALFASGLWLLTKNPLTAVILISLSDGIAILPTMRKAYYYPNEESVLPWFVGVFTYIFSILALDSRSLTNWLYPASIIFFDLVFVLEVWVRRSQLRAK